MSRWDEHVAEAEEHFRSYALAAAAAAYRRAWEDHWADWTKVERARVRKRQASLLLWSGDAQMSAQFLDTARIQLSAVAGDERDFELARCLVNLAAVEDQLGRPSRARPLLAEAQELCPPIGPEGGRIALAATAFHRQAGEVEAAEDLVNRADGLLDGASDRARLHLARADLAWHRGDTGDAESALHDARSAAESSGDALLVNEIDHRTASVEFARGRWESAKDRLTDVIRFYRDRGFRVLCREALLDMAALELARGDHVETQRWLTSADEADDGHSDPRSRARGLALAGTLRQASGDLVAAAHLHSEALDAVAPRPSSDPVDRRWAASERAGILMDLATDHLLTRRLRYVRRAVGLFDEAVAELRLGRVDRARIGLAKANLGVAHALLGDEAAALPLLEEASDEFAAAGRGLERSAVDLNRGCLLAASADDDDKAALRRAVQLLAAAALAQDAVRFDFSRARQRRQWWLTHARSAMRESLRVAERLGDSALVLQLVAGFRLSGTVQLSDALQDPSRRLVVVSSGTIFEGGSGVGVDVDALLQLRPAPRIRLADGSIALEDAIAAADDYGLPFPARAADVVSLT